MPSAPPDACAFARCQTSTLPPACPGPFSPHLQIMHRFHFSSVLKRMSTVVQAEGAGAPAWWLLSKGAPEVLQGLLASVPPHYERCYKVGGARGACLGSVQAAVCLRA